MELNRRRLPGEEPIDPETPLGVRRDGGAGQGDGRMILEPVRQRRGRPRHRLARLVDEPAGHGAIGRIRSVIGSAESPRMVVSTTN